MSRADISAGKAHVELYVKNSKFVKGLNSASKQLSSFGKDLAKIGGTFAAGGAAILGVLGSTISVASDMEEQMNKFNVVFGESSKAMKEWGDATGGALGRSKLQMATFLGSMQDLLVPMGIAPDAARELSKEMTTLAIDVASFNNAADADVIRDFQAALTGSGEVMKKYGVIVSEAAVKQELLSQGLDPKNVTEAQKAQARWNLIVKGTTAAAGDATRSAGSYANQMKALQGAITDARVELGQKILPIITPFVTKAKEAVKIIADWVSKNGDYIKSVAFVAAGITALGGAITTAGLAFVAIGKAIGAVSFALVTLTNPIGLVGLAVAGLTLRWVLFTEKGQAAAGAIVKGFQDAGKIISRVVQGIAAALSDGQLELAADIAATGIEVAFTEAIDRIKEHWWEALTEMMSVLSRLHIIAREAILGEEDLIPRGKARKAAEGASKETPMQRLEQLLERAAMPEKRREAAAEIEAVRDETSRMSDPDAVVTAQNAAIRQAEAETNSRIAAWMASHAPSVAVADKGSSRESMALLREQNRKLELMLNELRIGRAVYE